MSDVVLKVENLSKLYRLGEVGTGTLSHDLNRWWAKVRDKEDPFSKVGEINDRTSGANSKNGYVWSLKDVSFEVRRGDVLGVIGKNGAGKSTLLKLISQITAPTSGSIKAKGRIASLLEVGTGMHPEMTGRENIYLNGTILGMRKWEIDRKFDEIVDFAGCAKYVDTPVKRYSSGMKVRLGFAVAAFLEPEILIVDEVLAVGDAEFQNKAIGKMQEVSSEGGRTVFFVSHNMESITSLCNRTLVLKNGSISFDGETKKAIDFYISEVANFHEVSKLPREIDKSKTFFFDSIKFKRNDVDQNTTIVRSGEDVSIVFSYITMLPLGASIDVSIGFFTLDGSFLFACRSSTINIDVKIDERNQTVCLIPQLPLKPGKYKYNVRALYNNRLIDEVIAGGVIEVESGDYYNTGKSMAGGKAGVYINYQWLT